VSFKRSCVTHGVAVTVSLSASTDDAWCSFSRRRVMTAKPFNIADAHMTMGLALLHREK
jgi:hypothetical protein